MGRSSIRRSPPARPSQPRWYMVHAVWFAAGMPKREPMGYNQSLGDYLCIGCLEVRLRRALTRRDFTDAQLRELPVC
jgi:hypothetical protein